jgi:hypothetical protein
MLAECQPLRIRNIGLALIRVEQGDRLHSAAWRRSYPPANHLRLGAVSSRRAFP